MSRQPIIVQVSGKDYTLMPIPARKAMPLEIKCIKAVAPLLMGLQGIGGVLELIPKGEDGNPDIGALLKQDLSAILGRLDLDAVAKAVTSALDSLSEYELDSLVCGMMKYVTTFVPGKGVSTLSSPELVDSAFDDTLDIYKVMFEVARFNKMRPFALLSSGSATPPTAG